MKKHLVLSGLNPKSGGGISAITASFLEYFSSTFDIHFLYPFTRGRRTSSGIKGIRETECLKLPGTPREKQSFLLSLYSLKADIHQAIGGTSFEALPFHVKRLPYFLWTATTLKSEKQTQGISVSEAQLGLEKVLYRSAVKVFTISNAAKKEIESISERSDIVLLPPPVKDIFLALERKRPREKTILFTGRLNDRRKNIGFLLDIFKGYAKEHPETKLLLISQFPPEEDMMKRINALGDKVIIKIGEKDIIPYYKNASVFFLPSHQEGFGIALAEAMAAGIPVIVTKCGGPEDIVRHGENGFLLERGDAQGAVKYLDIMLNDQDESERLGRAGKEFIRNYLSKDRIFSVIGSEYNVFLQSGNK